MEDIARDAGVSVATAYNHFPTKHAVIGAVFAPVFAPALERAALRLKEEADPLDLLAAHILDVSELLHREFRLTKPFLEAVWDALVRFGVDNFTADDPRMLVPLPVALVTIISFGQDEGTFDAQPDAFDVAAFLVNSLSLQVFCLPNLPPKHAANLVVRSARGILAPNRPAGR